MWVLRWYLGVIVGRHCRLWLSLGRFGRCRIVALIGLVPCGNWMCELLMVSVGWLAGALDVVVVGWQCCICCGLLGLV